MRTAYLDCFSGVSGNMLLGALLHAGLDEEILQQVVASLPVSGCRLEVEEARCGGIAALRVRVSATAAQPHRRLDDIRAILGEMSLPEQVRTRSLAVFQRLAAAEAKVHGTDVNMVHFHEVGAVDALVDVVGVISGLHALGIGRVYCSALPMPSGWVSCAHGELPLPAPAVCALLEQVPVYGVELSGELVTPTGAALVRELARGFGPMPTMVLEHTGYGAGSMTREDRRPNLLRLCIGQQEEVAEAAEIEVLETHLDDWNAETWPHVSALLMEAGALDVSLTPLLMKKGRPGYLLRILCAPEHALALKECLFNETTAIGLRFHRQQRMTLPRRLVEVNTPWGRAGAKEISTPQGPVLTPEYDSCSRLARRAGVSLQEIYRHIAGLSGSPPAGTDRGEEPHQDCHG